MTQPRNLYLASRSPRRRELLDQIALDYQLLDIDIDERAIHGESPQAYVLRIATEKAQHALRFAPCGAWILAADTTVAIDSEILGKPRDNKDAARMLRALSARKHHVFTAIALASARGKTEQAVCETAISENQVYFREITDLEITTYIATGEPMDKAGAYAIQGRAAIFIEHLVGSYSGVMGLPLFEVSQLLNRKQS